MSKLQLSSNNSDSTLTLFTCTDIPFNNLLEQVEVATFVYPNTWKCWTKGAFWLSTRQISEEWNLNNMRIRHILIWKCYILSIWAGSCRIDINIFKSVATVHHDDCDTFVFSQNNMETVQNRPIVSSAGSIIILINEPSASVVTSYEIKTNNCSQSRTQTNDSFSFLHVNELRHTDVFSGASSDFCVFVLLDLVSRIRLINRVWCRFLCHLDDFWASLSCFLSFDGRAGARCSEAV